MSRATLALCIPAYKAEPYLPRILGSAKKQRIPFDEIVVYDDASPDGTAKVAESLGARVIRGKTNRGCTWGRKVLAENVKSDWIHFHDADDDMTEEFTTRARDWMSRPECPDVVLFNYDWVDESSDEVLGRTRFDHKMAKEDPILFTLKTQVNPFCGLYRTKSFLEAGGPDLDPEVRQCEDMAMHSKLALAGLSFAVEEREPVTIINYRQSESMSRNANAYVRLVHAVYRLYEKTYQRIQQGQKKNEYNRAIGERMWTHTRHAAWVSRWEVVRKAIQLAHLCDVPVPPHDSVFFRLLCQIHPFGAVVLREYFGRIRRKRGSYWY